MVHHNSSPETPAIRPQISVRSGDAERIFQHLHMPPGHGEVFELRAGITQLRPFEALLEAHDAGRSRAAAVVYVAGKGLADSCFEWSNPAKTADTRE
jgi:hypothetical protein